MLPPEKMRKADLLAAPLLIALGVVVIARSAQMPFGGQYGGVDNPWYASPAIFPLLVGFLLIVCSAIVAAHALREGGHRGFWLFWRERIRRAGSDAGLFRIAFILAWIAVYVFGMAGRLDFYWASGIFLFVFMAVFHRASPGASRLRKCLNLAWLLALGAGLSFATCYMFETYLQVPLP
ncbi:MAG: Tripartite tricarboxylate transporter TctB family protein [candidate division BRC1 bacterium ADurb.BinA364]|nr:MAG: Tripartite tricarboxylate transporter TctB family protein [candidate division BRC1 bacterium ADurb.BinA364]